MKTEEIIESLEEAIKGARPVPLTGKVMIESDTLLTMLSELSAALPNELKQAKAIVSDRSNIISAAKQEAEDIVRVAEERRKSMINESEIVRSAKATADQIMTDAKMKSREVRKAANDYVEEIMKRADEMLTANVNELRKTRQSIKASQRQGSGN